MVGSQMAVNFFSLLEITHAQGPEEREEATEQALYWMNSDITSQQHADRVATES
jgi:hypothetical protein